MFNVPHTSMYLRQVFIPFLPPHTSCICVPCPRTLTTVQFIFSISSLAFLSRLQIITMNRWRQLCELSAAAAS